MKEYLILRDKVNQYYTGGLPLYWSAKIDEAILFNNDIEILSQFKYARKNSQLTNAVEPIEVIKILQ
ncbi:MAG: hypothetical protein PHF86_01035 [Candidatus Nanoarchaeia archaeon]|nr:hypothetical protein [Candidatus Nanoarchaeia archaeon]